MGSRMTYKEISAWISSAAVLALYGYYAVEAPQAASRGEALNLYVKVAIAFLVLIVVLNAVASIIHRPEKTDERDKLIAAMAARNASFVFATGIVLVTLILLVPNPAFAAALSLPQTTMPVHLLVLTVAFAELLRHASVIVYYRRGV
jgi:hypothetical protein